MVNYKVEELRLGLEEEKEQSHDDDDHGISLAVARGMCSKTYAEKKIASHAGFKTPNDEEDYDQRTTLQTPAAFKDSLVKKERQGGILQSNIATDSTLNSSSSNNHCLAALSRAEVGTHKSIPIAFLDAYMKDEGPAIDSNVDVATTNSSIGDCLLALGRDGEALLCYEKVLMDFKNLKGDNHSLVASVFVNLAEFHLRLTNLVKQNPIVKLHSGAMENRELDIPLEMLLMGWLTLLPFLRN
ncbi:unnamed protein product [Sphagnum jensenii]|uniref:Uncharacterized protein n=1 Tax=Sphagnum jensenii TaxID=128206 RepID=A0ABP0VR53_9BRYO